MLPNIVTSADLHTLIPEIFVCSAAFGLLMVDLFLSPQRRGLTHFLALLILVAAAVLTVRDMASVQTFAFSNFFVRDVASDVLKIGDVRRDSRLSSSMPSHSCRTATCSRASSMCCACSRVLGMMLMVSAGSLVTLYLGLELLALSSYGLVGTGPDNRGRLGSGHEVLHPRLDGVGPAAVRHVHDLRRDRQPAARRDLRRHRPTAPAIPC